MSDKKTPTEKLIELCKNPNQPDVATSVENLRDAISKGANLNTIVYSNEDVTDTPLLLACKNNADLQFIEILLEKGANPNIPAENYKGLWAPLSWLGHHREHPEYYEILSLLINSDKLDPNFKDKDGYTYLYDLFPLKETVLEFIKIHGHLLEPDIINARCFDNNSSMLLACCREYNDQDNIKIIRALLELGADPNIPGDGDVKDEWTSLAIVAHTRAIPPQYRDDIITLLINSDRLNPNTHDPHGYSYLYDLHKYPHLLLDFLIKKDRYIDPNILNERSYSDNNTLIMYCCSMFENLDNQILSALNESRASRRREQRLGVRHEDAEAHAVAESMMAANAAAAEKIWETSAVTASLYNKIIKKLVELGAEVNNPRGQTALDYLDRFIPESIPPGPINDFMAISLDTYDFLANNNAMTSKMLAIRSTPVIKRPELANNNNDRPVLEPPSPAQVRNAFIRDWYHRLHRELRVGGKRKTRKQKSKKRGAYTLKKLNARHRR